MSIFAKAAAYLNLSPGERALLRFGEGLAVSAGIAGLQAVMPLLNSGSLSPAAIPWSSVAHTFVATVLGAVGAAVVKFFKAQGDPQLPPVNPPAVSSAASAASAASAGPAPAAGPVAAAVATVPPIVGGTPA